jgi:hypothetical protein
VCDCVLPPGDKPIAVNKYNEEKNGMSHYTVQDLTADILYNNSCHEEKNVWYSKLRILVYGNHPIMFIN